MAPLGLLLWASLAFQVAARVAGRALKQDQSSPANVNTVQELKEAVQAGHERIHFQSDVTATMEAFPELSLACVPGEDIRDPVAFIKACQPDAVFYEGYEAGTASAVWTADPGVVLDVRFLQLALLVGRPLELSGMRIAQQFDDRWPYFYFFGTFAKGLLLFTDSTIYSPCGLGDPRYIEDHIIWRLIPSVDSQYTIDDADTSIHMEHIGPVELVDSINEGELTYRNTTMQCYDYRSEPFAAREIPSSWIAGAATTVADAGAVCQRAITIGEDFRGAVATTATGLPCQYWNTTTPQDHTRAPSRLPEYGLGASDQDGVNYCRNPDNMVEGVWCYIASEKLSEQFKRWEYCDVPWCSEEEEQALVTAAAEEGQSSESDGGSVLGTAGLVVVCIVCALLLALVALLFAFRHRLARYCHQASRSTHSSPGAASPNLPMVPLQIGLLTRSEEMTRTKPSYPDYELSRPVSQNLSTMTAHNETRSTTSYTLHTTSSWPSNAPAEAPKGKLLAKYAPSVEALQDALDDMHTQEQLLVQRWEVQSAAHRRVGGQGVVQFVKDTKHSNEEAVVKFFLDSVAFQREADLYRKPEVREMMAAVVDLQDNAAGALTANNGLTLPPFIVLEKGRSLNEWALITRPDYVTSLQVLVQIVERLHAIHDCGLVHRDVKPANILFRHSVGQWTLIDFGCATAHGEERGIACSVPYAAPEVAQALKDKRKLMIADTSMDVWALGVVIWELFSGLRAWQRESTADTIIDALTSSTPLPWEAGGAHAESMTKLGLVKRVVRLCLSRNPKSRPSAETLLGTMDSLLCAATSMAHDDTES